MAKLCEFTTVSAGDVIGSPSHNKNYVYFPLDACVAMLVRPTEGALGLAIGLVGSEGAVGLQHAFGLGAGNVTLVVQATGGVLRIEGITIAHLLKNKPDIVMLFSRYLWTVYQEVAFMAALTQMQDVKSRLAGWLLLSVMRTHTLQLKLKQSYLAHMLGVRRTSVTLAALELKQQGVIDYSRGYLNILDEAALKAAAHWTVLSN